MLGRDWVQVVVVVAGETRNKKKYKGERREERGERIKHTAGKETDS